MRASETEEGAPSRESDELEIFADPATGLLNVNRWPFGFPDLSALEVAGSHEWAQIGPAPLKVEYSRPKDGGFDNVPEPDSGEVTDIAIDPSGDTDQIIYIATDDGGIWKTTDGGVSWRPKGDFLPSLSMGAVALDPSDYQIVYAGTGNLFDPGGVFAKGVGIYKSIDGGESWAHMDGGIFATLFANVGINRIVAPASGILLVATDKGLFRSEDGGLNFGDNSPQYNNGKPILAGYISDLRLDTTASNTVYAAVFGQGVFKSSDAGKTFPTNLFTASNGAPPKPYGAISFAQSTHPNNQTIYASVQYTPPHRLPRLIGLFKSTDGGGSWQRVNRAEDVINGNESSARQTLAGMTIGIDPQKADLAYFGNVELWCLEGGSLNFPNFDCTSGRVHVDHHALAFSPSTHFGATPTPPTRLYVGTDGGISKSDDGGVTWKNLNANLGANLITDIGIGQGAGRNAYTYCGMQDQGIGGHRPADSGFPADPDLEWVKITFGDGGQVAVDPADPKIIYGFILTEFFKITSRGEKRFRTIAKAVTRTSGRNISPIEIHMPQHGFRKDQIVFVSGVTGNTAANSTWRVEDVTSGSFKLYGPKATGETSVGNGDYTGGGIVTAAVFVPITGATNASPIEITAPEHPFKDDDIVFIEGVKGNTAANNRWKIRKSGADKFQLLKLDGSNSQGNAAYESGGLARGPGVGRNLQTPAGERSIALEQTGSDPASRVVYVSEAMNLYRSDNAGIEFGKKKTFESPVTTLATTSHNRDHLWVGLENGDVHFSADGGTSWDANQFKITPGPKRPVRGITIDPRDVSRVAIVYSGFSGVNPVYRTLHCFLTSDGGRQWKDISGTDGAGPVGNLPDIPLYSVVWDSSSNPSTLIVASDAGVMRSANLGASWQSLGAGLPPVSCQSLAIDNSVTPRVLRVGTYGRSCFELKRFAGPHLAIRANLGFGAVATGRSADLPARFFNTGDAELEITSFSRILGDGDFEITPAPALPLKIEAGGQRSFVVRFQPAGAGNKGAVFGINSNAAVDPIQFIFASGWNVASPTTPRLAVNASLNFGIVKTDENRALPLQLINTGLGPLEIKKISRTIGSSDFELVSPPAFPFTLQPGESRDLTVRFQPSSNSGLEATFEIESNDPRVRDGKPAGTQTIRAQGVGDSAAGSHLREILIILGIVAVIAIGVVVAEEEL